MRWAKGRTILKKKKRKFKKKKKKKKIEKRIVQFSSLLRSLFPDFLTQCLPDLFFDALTALTPRKSSAAPTHLIK